MEKRDSMNRIEEFLTGARDKEFIRQTTPDGFMELTAYYILPGIYLTLNDIHTELVPVSQSSLSQQLLLMNYCMEGRCEFRISDDSYSYLSNRLMNISSRMAQDYFYYPSSCYKGYEIYILPARFTDKTRDILHLFHIDVDELISLYTYGAAFYVSDTVLRLWNQVSLSNASGNIGQLRLDTLQLLKHFHDNRPADTPNLVYLSKVQVLLAKKAQEILTQNLNQHFSIKSVSEALAVSETSLKRYFLSVYGTTISAYMNEVRMKHAAELLADSNLSISDIARACGYVNQGRFAGIFRKYYGMKPLDYRRKSRLQEAAASTSS